MATINIWKFCAFISLINCLSICVTAQLAPNSVEICASVCESTFVEYEKTVCIRGCRLMSLLGFIHGPMMSTDELKQACLKTCGDAYKTTNASACAFGCQSQLPIVEERRNQLMEFSMNVERDPLCAMTQRFIDYSNRIMNDLMSGLNNRAAKYGWVSITSYSSNDGGNVVVVVDGSPRINVQSLPEHKTSSRLGISLDMRGRGVEQAAAVDDIGVYDQSTDLFGYLSDKTHLSRMTVFVLFLTGVMVLLWCIVALCFPSSRIRRITETNQKLSIYGDLEYLPVYDDTFPTFKKEKLDQEALPLPIKSEKI